MTERANNEKAQSKKERRRKKRKDGRPTATDLIEEGMYLLRKTPLMSWTFYVCGAVPFIFGFLFFWTEMISSGLATRSLLPGSLALGVLFVAFKVAQAYYVKGLYKALCDAESPGWSTGHWFAEIRRQAFWQPTGLVILPIAFVLTIPFARLFAFYQNMLISGSQDSADDGEIARESWRLAKIWPEQNWILITLLGLVYILSFFNWLTLLMVGPNLLKTFLGIETVFSRAGVHLFNTSSLFICSLLAYVVTDPLVKAVYLLRRHYGESLRSGADLRLRLKRCLHGSRLGSSRLAVLLVFVALPMIVPVGGELLGNEGTDISSEISWVTPDQLNTSIDEVLERREFAWRFPREEMKEDKELELSWLVSLIETLKRWKERIDYFLENLFGPDEATKSNSNALPAVGTLLSYTAIFAFVVLVIYFAVRAFRSYQPVQANEGTLEPVAQAVPDLNKELSLIHI